jgi:hypothetical protein
MHHQAAGQGKGGLIRRSRTDAGERRRARQPGEFCRRDADRGDNRLRLGCLVPWLVAASAEPGRQDRSADPGQAAGEARDPADAGEMAACEPPVVSAQCLSPSLAGCQTPA